MNDVRVDQPADLDAAAIAAVSDGARVSVTVGLTERLGASRAATLSALATAGPVYGVTTGMGSQAHLAVGAEHRPSFQGDLMLARSVGTAPWLDARTVRALLAVRLGTLLQPEVGASPDLVGALARLLETDLHPAVPATGNGAAGEIIPLAHLGGFLAGVGEGVDGTASGSLLQRAGLAPYAFGAKEGVAFLQGVPTSTARAVLLVADVRLLLVQQLTVAAAEVALVRAPHAPYHPALARGDDELAWVHAALLALVGGEDEARMLQAPVSFRVVGPALAHLSRSLDQLEAAVARALTGVTTSPALVEGRFLGTAGFDGFDLAATADAVRLAVLHVAETGAARLHRLLDPRVSGLPSQLSGEPGRQAGLVAVHKRAVGLLHQARRTSGPASLGATDTSSGQEDVQSFALEAMAAAHEAADVLRDVTATELVAVHQAWRLDEDVQRGSRLLRTVLHKAFEPLPATTLDRAFGREIADLRHGLGVGWAHDVLDSIPDAPTHPSHPTV